MEQLVVSLSATKKPKPIARSLAPLLLPPRSRSGSRGRGAPASPTAGLLLAPPLHPAPPRALEPGKPWPELGLEVPPPSPAASAPPPQRPSSPSHQPRHRAAAGSGRLHLHSRQPSVVGSLEHDGRRWMPWLCATDAVLTRKLGLEPPALHPARRRRVFPSRTAASPLSQILEVRCGN
ncbi:WAS/WASL-interacting protein family member 2-like [Triticum dicoccoides]|uniref:WAS/WASL-interacting protein family member 2-like n=1 Tax=Triticum dicoccoides TaxID=85692 RepID=UPI00189047BD|nr:WAS/WASL-interacting protein family member 2-like [Triticum dicoccoides]